MKPPIWKRILAASETHDFAEYALNVNPGGLPPSQVRRFCEETLKIPTLPPVEKRQGPRFQPGDLIKIDQSKHLRPETIEKYKIFDSHTGKVLDIEGTDVTVRLDSGHTVRFEDANLPRGSGMYRNTPVPDMKGSPQFEMIYSADPTSKTTDAQRLTVELYVQRGAERGDLMRPINYYSGYAFSGREGQSGWYFSAGPKQRLSEIGSAQFRSFNPSKGRVHYIGLMGHRPSGWKERLSRLLLLKEDL